MITEKTEGYYIMNNFEFRGLELHNSRMWNWNAVERALNFMHEFGFNALIFHQNDLMDQIVLPREYFSEEMMWEYWPIRLCAIGTNGEYIRKVIREAKKRGIDFFLQVKEIWYPEELLERFPELRTKEGYICATDPFWFQFLELKTKELLEDFPDIGGIIVSPATRESKVSIAANRCECERCRATEQKDWYTGYLKALYRPLEKAGKTLIVRDFSYTVGAQNAVIAAVEECSKDIVIGLKNTPHDFWPVFPDNVRIGTSNGLREYIEFDVVGQYCGLGVFPCSLVEDLKKRLDYCRDKGSTGLWCRTDWELLDEVSTFNSFNQLNLIAAGMLSRDPSCDLDSVYKAWTNYGLFSSLREESRTGEPVRPTSKQAVEKLKNFMIASWSVIEKTLYVRGHVFQYSSRFQHAIRSIYNIMMKYHQREQWEPGSSANVAPTAENIDVILGEKEQAKAEVRKLSSILEVDSLGLPREFADEITDMLDLYTYYVDGFAHMAKAYFMTQKSSSSGDEQDITSAKLARDELAEFSRKLRARLENTSYPFYVYWLMDYKELDMLVEDIDHLLK
jgi:hypothetical protein